MENVHTTNKKYFCIQTIPEYNLDNQEWKRHTEDQYMFQSDPRALINT